MINIFEQIKIFLVVDVKYFLYGMFFIKILNRKVDNNFGRCFYNSCVYSLYEYFFYRIFNKCWKFNFGMKFGDFMKNNIRVKKQVSFGIFFFFLQVVGIWSVYLRGEKEQ